MLEIKDAGHAEYDENVATPLIVLVSCPVETRPEGAPRLWGKLKIRLSPGSLAYCIYRHSEVEEEFNCSYELNPEFIDTIERSGLKVSGRTENGGARIIELTKHRFFLATAFLPQLTSGKERPHPLITAYLRAALQFQQANDGFNKQGK